MTSFFDDALVEMYSAHRQHGPIKSPHEGYAILLEELDEFWEEVKKKEHDPVAMRKELVQLAAMTCHMALLLGQEES